MSAPAEFSIGPRSRGLADPSTADRVEARADGRAEFEQLVALHSGALWGLAGRLSGNAADAEDLVQETFLKAFRARGKLRKRGSERAWLRRILVNAWRDRLKEGPGTVQLADPAGITPDPADGLARKDLLERVEAGIRDLPRRQREALLLRVRGRLSYAEIAGAMAIRKGAVKAHLVQARRKLLARFGKEIEEWT